MHFKPPPQDGPIQMHTAPAGVHFKPPIHMHAAPAVAPSKPPEDTAPAGAHSKPPIHMHTSASGPHVKQ